MVVVVVDGPRRRCEAVVLGWGEKDPTKPQEAAILSITEDDDKNFMMVSCVLFVDALCFDAPQKTALFVVRGQRFYSLSLSPCFFF